MNDETNTLTGSAEGASSEPAPEAATEQTAETQETTPETTDKPETQEGKTTPEGEDGKSDEGAESPEAQEEKAKKKGRFQKRIDDLTQRSKTAERRAAEAEKRADRLEERLKRHETPEPRETDFDTHEEYIAALAAHKVQQNSKAVDEQDAQDARAEAKEAAEEASGAQAEAWNERLGEFAERVPDALEKITDPTLQISDEMGAELQSSPKGPEIAYFLANNRTEAARIAGLNGADVTRAIARIEGQITRGPSKRATQAPDPVKAVATGSGSQGVFNPNDASTDEIASRLKAKGVIAKG